MFSHWEQKVFFVCTFFFREDELIVKNTWAQVVHLKRFFLGNVTLTFFVDILGSGSVVNNWFFIVVLWLEACEHGETKA